MKLATLNNGTPDGQLIVVDGDLQRAVLVPSIAVSMQKALENWDRCYPLLHQISLDLATDKLSSNFRIFEFVPSSKQNLAPLPRAYQLINSNAYLNHNKTINSSVDKEVFSTDKNQPVMYPGWSSSFISPSNKILFNGIECAIDFSAELAIVTKYVPMGCSIYTAQDSISLYMLSCNIILTNLLDEDLSNKVGLFHSQPFRSFAPVAVTEDALGINWHEGKLKMNLQVKLNGKDFGLLKTDADMDFNFYQLIKNAAKIRALPAGTIITTGPISNVKPLTGCGTILEKRAKEKNTNGKPETEFLSNNDVISIDIQNSAGLSLFGPIEHKIVIRKV